MKNQAERVCQLLENALHIYTNLYETDDKIFIITPFRTVAESMRKFVITYKLKVVRLIVFSRIPVTVIHRFLNSFIILSQEGT